MVKKKIVILTQPLGTNYGGIIQNFALQTVLSKNGYEPITYNRRWNKNNPFIEFIGRLRNETLRRLTGSYRFYLTPAQREASLKNCYAFMDNNMNVSDSIYTSEELVNRILNDSFSAIVVGSDQVWRPKYSPNIYNYFFDFLEHNREIKKLSYAASFGTDAWEFDVDQSKRCAQLLQSFDAVSVREDSGVQLCEKYLNRKAELVLDPTLLLEREEYLKVANSFSKERKGLFAYVLDNSEGKHRIISDISEKLGLTTFYNQPKYKNGQSKHSIASDYTYPPIEGWLKAFDQCNFVVADSFHGMVFAIIFNKPFVAIANKDRGASRFTSLLDLLGLTDRLVYSYEDYASRSLSFEINFDEVNEKLNLLKKSSLEFLLGNLSSDKED